METDEFARAARAPGLTIPIIPGIMPIQNYQSFRRMTNLCKSCIPAPIVAALERIQVSTPARNLCQGACADIFLHLA